MIKQELEGLLEEDPFGTENDLVKRVYLTLQEEYEPRLFQCGKVATAFEDGKNPKIFHRLSKYPSKENLEEAASILQLDVDPLAEYFDLHKKYKKEFLEKLGVEELKEKGRNLLKSAPVLQFVYCIPYSAQKPFIVLYTRDSCLPCNMTKPTFARLAHFYDQQNLARLYYTEDRKAKEKEYIRSVPKLVAYTDNGKIFNEVDYRTTKELWDVMNELVIQGRDFEGLGELCKAKEGYKIIKRE